MRPHHWLLLAFLSLALGAPASAEGALARIRARGTLVIGTDATYPPFEEKIGDRFEGFDIDLGNAIADLLGVRAEWVNHDFAGIFAALASGKFDLVISDVVITEERQKAVAFSDPYYRAGQAVVVRADNTTIRGAQDLPGRRVGAQLGTTGQFALEKIGGVEIVKYNTTPDALQDLANGRTDAVVGDLPAVRVMIRKGFPTLKTAGGVFTDEHYAVVARQEDADLLSAVNAALALIRARGDYDRFRRRWLSDTGEATVATPIAGDAHPRIHLRPEVLAREWPQMLVGAWVTLRLTLLALLFGIPIGLAAALGRLSRFRPLSLVAATYVEVVRGTPLLVQIFFIYFVLPAVGLSFSQFLTAILALSINAGAYIAEIFRAGIESIDIGQMEAARSLGLNYPKAMRWVILPQTFRRVLPPLTNEGIALLKDSSLVSIMGMMELTRAGHELASRYALPMTIWPAIAVLYLAMTLPLTRLAGYLEARWDYLRRA
ncbi:MAG: ABC transporter permease subunit [Armatimonadetes bacterium]|nr:ABC transporter permease subunit [Armatimonadota bacterium]